MGDEKSVANEEIKGIATQKYLLSNNNYEPKGYVSNNYKYKKRKFNSKFFLSN